MSSSSYSKGFYASQSGGSSQSASVIVPQVLEIARPASVIDVGAGVGTWAAQFLNQGVRDVLAVDGDYVDQQQLKVPRENFLPMDLTKTITLSRTFDLAVCLEVAEHLPESRAQSFISDLTTLAPLVLFSAAIPGQGGTYHINEQWPEYWRDIFEARDFQLIDCFRRLNWHDQRIDPWYRQNLFLFVRSDQVGRFSNLDCSGPLAIVHPLTFQSSVDAAMPDRLFPALVRSSGRTVLSSFRRLLSR